LSGRALIKVLKLKEVLTSYFVTTPTLTSSPWYRLLLQA